MSKKLSAFLVVSLAVSPFSAVVAAPAQQKRSLNPVARIASMIKGDKKKDSEGTDPKAKFGKLVSMCASLVFFTSAIWNYLDAASKTYKAIDNLSKGSFTPSFGTLNDVRKVYTTFFNGHEMLDNAKLNDPWQSGVKAFDGLMMDKFPFLKKEGAASQSDTTRSQEEMNLLMAAFERQQQQITLLQQQLQAQQNQNNNNQQPPVIDNDENKAGK